MKRTLIAAVAVLFLTGSVGFADKPVRNVSASRHPNIAAAQSLVSQAYEKVTAAQKANEFDMGGHAAKAKDLLEQASNELKEAALAANAK